MGLGFASELAVAQGCPTPPVSLLCSHSSSLECRYWDEEQLAWSTEGCATVLYNGTDGAGGGGAASGGFVGCECTHLSDFVAVKVRAKPNPGPGLALTLASWQLRSAEPALPSRLPL